MRRFELQPWMAAVPPLVALGAHAMRRRRRTDDAKQARPPTSGDGWTDADAPRRIREIAAPIEQASNWPGLGDFLVAKAWTESRGNPQAGGDTGNVARGLFGLRPRSARVEDVGLSDYALKQEHPAVALAAWYAYRMRDEADPGQIVDWLAVARGWAYPRLVSDVDETAKVKGWSPGARSKQVRFNFEEALTKGAGVPPTFMFERAFPLGFQWPGIEQVLAMTNAVDVA